MQTGRQCALAQREDKKRRYIYMMAALFYFYLVTY